MSLTSKLSGLFFYEQKRKRQLNALIEERYQSLYRLAYAWCHQKSHAEDLVQETFLKALEHSESLQQLDALDAWLVKIMRNRFLDTVRYNQRWKMVDEIAIDHFYSADCNESVLIEQQTSECLCQAMASLPFEQREVIALVDLQGFSYQQISEITGAPIGTVMSRISRGRDNLIKRMQQIEKGQSKIVALRR